MTAPRFDTAIWAEVAAERVRAHALHADTSMEETDPTDPTGRRFRILMEEAAEVGMEWNDAEHEGRPVDFAAVRKELIQTAAMAGAWADAIGQMLAEREYWTCSDCRHRHNPASHAFCDGCGASPPDDPDDQADTCRIFEVDGEPVLYHGMETLSPEAKDALGAVVRAAKAKWRAEHDADPDGVSA